jgi:hypothetical protein
MIYLIKNLINLELPSYHYTPALFMDCCLECLIVVQVFRDDTVINSKRDEMQSLFCELSQW